MRQYMYSLQHSMYHRGKHVASDIYYSLESNFIALLGVSIWEDNIIYSFTFVFLVCIRSYPPALFSFLALTLITLLMI